MLERSNKNFFGSFRLCYALCKTEKTTEELKMNENSKNELLLYIWIAMILFYYIIVLVFFKEHLMIMVGITGIILYLILFIAGFVIIGQESYKLYKRLRH